MTAARHERGNDSAQLMLLGGIVLVTGFLLVTGVGVEIRGIERTAVAELGDQVLPFQIWRELRVVVESEVRSLTPNWTSAQQFSQIQLPKIAAVYEGVLEDYDLNGRVSIWTDGESDLHDGAYYDAWSHDGGTHFTEPYFGSDDGILQTSPCPADLGDTADCIIGVLLRFEVTAHDRGLAEPILFSLR